MKKEEENKGESERETKGRKTVGMKGEENPSIPVPWSYYCGEVCWLFIIFC